MMKTKRSSAGLTMIEVIIASVILTAIVAMASYMVWMSSYEVSERELGLQLESQARLIVTQIANDIRQSKALYVKSCVGGVPALLPGIIAPGKGFTGIQLRTPGAGMDSSSINTNMSATAQAAWGNNYVLNNDQYLTRLVRYYWAVDSGEGEIANQTIDDNKDGRIDEGVLKKEEWVTDPAGNLITQTGPILSPVHTTICRDLRPCDGIPANATVFTPASTADNQITLCNWGLQFFVDANPPTKITITLTLEKTDPKQRAKIYNRVHTIVKQVQTTVDMRN
jgi:hypothetical protein